MKTSGLELCESVAEVHLLAFLRKTGLRFQQQYKVGKYRVDAVTESKVFKCNVRDGMISIAEANRMLVSRLRLMKTIPFSPKIGWEVDGLGVPTATNTAWEEPRRISEK